MSQVPEYTVRVSAKARRIGLRVLPGRGLEVVLPVAVDPTCVPVVLQRHSRWIEKALTRMQSRAKAQTASASKNSSGIPVAFHIHGGAEYIIIQPHQKVHDSDAVSGLSLNAVLPAPLALAEYPSALPHLPPPSVIRRVILPATLHPTLAPQAVLRWIREWVRKEARLHFAALLRQLAVDNGFAYADLRLKFQRSRWGSCSGRGNINLNACLLFLPDVLTRYIALHELCHTKELNHSAEFWKIVFAINPDALEHDKAMRSAWRYVPEWVLRERGV